MESYVQPEKLPTGEAGRVAWVVDALGRIFHGDKGRVETFLNRSHPLLEGKTPLDLAVSSSAGGDAVLDLVRRAEAGVAL